MSPRSVLILGIFIMMYIAAVSAADDIVFDVGEVEVIATRPQLVELGLNWFMDSNLGVLAHGDMLVMYGANGARPVRVTATRDGHLTGVDTVTIKSDNPRFRYLSGGPVYRDPESGRLVLFYHAEIYRNTARNFYSVVGLAVQVDHEGMVFQDLGPVFVANVPEEEAVYPVEVCGAPFIIVDDYFLVYARDELRTDDVQPGDRLARIAEVNQALERDGYVTAPREAQGAPSAQSELSVARARVSEVLQGAREGRPAAWWKYADGAFSAPALGGKSSPLETGNPRTRWMDVSYNTAIRKYIMVAAAPGADEAKTVLIAAWSDDGIHWSKRVPLADDGVEMFFPSIVGMGDEPRQTGRVFYVYYTSSVAGAWDRWSDAAIVRRAISVTRAKD